jgi:YVTN family beta-propeller protein
MHFSPLIKRCAAIGAAVGLLCAAGAGAQASGAPEYHLAKTVHLGAPDRWDYVVFDAPSHRVYVAHGDRVTVVDGHDGKIIGDVTGMPGGTHGTAVSHAAGLGYTDDGRAGEAAAFDLRSLRVVKRLKAAPDADAIVADPASGHVFVVDGDSGTLTVIDPRADRVIATIQLGSGLEAAVAGGDGKLYVNGAEKRVIFRVDTSSNRMDAEWPIPECASPHGIAIDTAAHRLFSSCVNARLVALDTDSGKLLATLPIGRGTDSAAFDPRHKLILSSNGIDGTVSIIREVNANTFEPAGTLRTAVSARTMGIDPQTGRLYIAAADVDLQAMAEFQAARAAHQRPRRMPFVPGSLKLLFFDPAQ